jgi:hypothetical protein
VISLAIDYIGGETTRRDLPAAAIILLRPPAALLLMGIAMRWAFLGFQGDDPDRTPGA